MKLNAILLAGTMLFVATGAQAQSSSLVGLYTFDSAAALGQDRSGNGNNLVAYGPGATFTANGASGGGLLLDGASYLSTTSQSVPGLFPTGNSAYTLSVTFKTASSNLGGLIGWGAYGNYDQVNALRTDGASGLYNYWWANDIYAGPTVNDNQFHTVTASWDGTTRSLYFDGTLLNSDRPVSPNVGNGNFGIGVTFFHENFVGTLDNVAIFNQAETPTQVTAAIDAASAVPEPATWAMMVLGFGLVGAGLRSRAKGRTTVSFG